MEEEQVLDPESELYLFVLRFIFLPHINYALEFFRISSLHEQNKCGLQG